MCEALGWKRARLYRYTQPSAGLKRIPHRRLRRLMVFAAGDVRRWIETQEDLELPSNLRVWRRRTTKR